MNITCGQCTAFAALIEQLKRVDDCRNVVARLMGAGDITKSQWDLIRGGLRRTEDDLIAAIRSRLFEDPEQETTPCLTCIAGGEDE